MYMMCLVCVCPCMCNIISIYIYINMYVYIYIYICVCMGKSVNSIYDVHCMYTHYINLYLCVSYE